ncbi:MAG TPA: cytochrome c oxidase accessory protein CcoG [Rhodocyclaceae bacterium]|nr:cytochrome c oxidase accessory protein CcoG [Rhodocyclaceae bacterium]
MSEAAPPPQPQGPAAIEQSLYEVRHKIHPRAVTGWFATWRWSLVWFTQLLFYGLCWLPWNGRQAVLFELAERKFYIFGLIFWPQDVFYLAILLIVAAYSLFLFTAIGGRLFCGYACPQTVYTEIFLWIERKIEGDRHARIRLDDEPLSAHKLGLKAAKHGAWIAVALWTGFTFVGYFTPIRTLASEVLSLSLGPWETFWVLFYGFATYGNAGWMREQVCKYMCPYARFQSVMFDPDTLIVTYDAERGEPRGSRSKKADYKAEGKGDCVDCGICVQVCPTGIDIRDGLQYECIGCSACIDACDQVMDKMNYPRGLIRYSTENALLKKWGRKEILGHILRPRIMIYGVILMLIIAAAAAGLASRLPLKVDVIRDRGTLAREEDHDMIENSFRLQIMNVSETPRRYTISVSGLAGIEIESEHIVDIPAATTRSVVVEVHAPAESGKKGFNRIHFEVSAVDDEKIAVREPASFLLP